MRLLRRLLLALALVALPGCDWRSRGADPISDPEQPRVFLTARDEMFRLSAAERTRLPAAIDADALERLLSWIPHDDRAELLGFYHQLGKEKVALGPAFGTTGNPQIDSIIARVVVTER
jgi:hypothetical protein